MDCYPTGYRQALAESLSTPPTSQQLNTPSKNGFLSRYAHLFEHSPWIIQKAAETGWPFESPAQMIEQCMKVLSKAPQPELLAVIMAHPELGNKLQKNSTLTFSSRHEQGSAGLDTLSDNEYALFHQLNTAYKKRFSFPFIICVRQHNKAGILHAMQQRLDNTPEQELCAALDEIGKIAAFRLSTIINTPNHSGENHG